MIITIITFAIIISVLIFVHELGHFLAAKAFGIRVDEFAVGFPPRIWSKTKGGTKYSLGILPIGGYVKIYGEDAYENPTEIVAPDSIMSKPRWAQAIVLVAGVVFNVLFAWILLSVPYIWGKERIAPLDHVGPVNVTVLDVIPDSPSALAGLQSGDIIKTYQVNNTAYNNFNSTEVINKIKQTDSITFYIDRSGEQVELKIEPSVMTDGGSETRRIGAYLADTVVVKSVFLAPWYGAVEAYDLLNQMRIGLAQIFVKLFNGESGEVAENISGPVGIAKIVNQAKEQGFDKLVFLTIIISLNLALINILPFPALDGGRLLILGIEGTIRRNISPKVVAIIHMTGMFILLGLMILITINDIGKL